MRCPSRKLELHPQQPEQQLVLNSFKQHSLSCSSCARWLSRELERERILAELLAEVGDSDPEECPEPHELAAWLAGEREGLVAEAMEWHFSGCPGCRGDILLAHQIEGGLQQQPPRYDNSPLRPPSRRVSSYDQPVYAEVIQFPGVSRTVAIAVAAALLLAVGLVFIVSQTPSGVDVRRAEAPDEDPSGTTIIRDDDSESGPTGRVKRFKRLPDGRLVPMDPDSDSDSDSRELASDGGSDGSEGDSPRSIHTQFPEGESGGGSSRAGGPGRGDRGGSSRSTGADSPRGGSGGVSLGPLFPRGTGATQDDEDDADHEGEEGSQDPEDDSEHKRDSENHQDDEQRRDRSEDPSDTDSADSETEETPQLADGSDTVPETKTTPVPEIEAPAYASLLEPDREKDYAWESYQVAAVPGAVTLLFKLSKDELLVGSTPAQLDVLEDGKLETVASDVPNPSSAVEEGKDVFVAASGGRVFQGDEDGEGWALSWESGQGEALVGALGKDVYAFSGTSSQVAGRVVRLKDGAWEDAGAFAGIPTAAVKHEGLLYVGASAQGGPARIYWGSKNSWMVLPDLPLLPAGPGERQQITQLLSKGGFLFIGVGMTDATSGDPSRDGALLVWDGQSYSMAATLMLDVPTALAYHEDTVFVGTKTGKLYYLDASSGKGGKGKKDKDKGKKGDDDDDDDDGDGDGDGDDGQAGGSFELLLVEEPLPVMNSGVHSLLVVDKDSLLIGLEGLVGPELLLREKD